MFRRWFVPKEHNLENTLLLRLLTSQGHVVVRSKPWMVLSLSSYEKLDQILHRHPPENKNRGKSKDTLVECFDHLIEEYKALKAFPLEGFALIVDGKERVFLTQSIYGNFIVMNQWGDIEINGVYYSLEKGDDFYYRIRPLTAADK
jgi:hypothetical protein